MEKLSFQKVCVVWFFSALILNVINMFTIKNSFLYSLIFALLGIFLLICPLYPKSLEWHYEKEQCRRIVRIAAIIEIIGSFCIKMNF